MNTCGKCPLNIIFVKGRDGYQLIRTTKGPEPNKIENH